MYNADGSRGEMCGNGVRCVGKYMYDYGLTDKTEITVETLAGIKTLQLFVENGKVAKVRVDMGSPILTPAEIPVVAEGDNSCGWKRISYDLRIYGKSARSCLCR